jgi:hypothetical protein
MTARIFAGSLLYLLTCLIDLEYLDEQNCLFVGLRKRRASPMCPRCMRSVIHCDCDRFHDDVRYAS